MSIYKLPMHRFLCLASLIAAPCLIITSIHSAHAQFAETESNNTKPTANVLNLGTGTSATISGASATSGDIDYYRINTTYQTPGIYRNQIQLSNTTQFTGSIRSLTQVAGVVTAGSDVLFQSSLGAGTATPYDFNQYYSFGGTNKTQSMNYRILSSSSSTGGAYTATFSSSLITPTDIGNFTPGTLNFSALANIGSSGVATNTEIVVLDSNYNVYYDNVASSPTFGFAAVNDNAAAGFNLTRNFDVGTYYIAIGIGNVATNDSAPTDEATTSRNNPVLDFDNVIATNNTFYNGNNGNTRPANFAITDSDGAPYSSSGQVIPSLYALNFYSFTVRTPAAIVPEAGTLALILPALGLVGAATLRRVKAS
ncbi:MAG: PEP-CTERM sorting domain-containing protein [Fibrella sp.]|nr:PEP-CTERM sorting domain-containing protein [Armatimonadota bacterium]